MVAKKFTGELSKPILRISRLAIALSARGKSQDGSQAAFAEADRIDNEKLNANYVRLFAHYGIDIRDPNMWPRLALCLARDFVPGVNLVDTRPRGRGAPKGGKYQNWELVRDVEDVAQVRRKGIADACHILVKRTGQWKNSNAQTVQTAYYEVKKAQEKAKADMMEWKKNPSEEWQRIERALNEIHGNS